MDYLTAKEHLIKSIQIQTVNGREADLAHYFKDLLKDYPVSFEEVIYQDPSRTGLIVTYDTGKPGKTLVFCGHMDVVPVGDLDWDYPPFDPVEVDGRLYGRGATDMKSGLVAMLAAFVNLIEADSLEKGQLKLIFTPDEENGGSGARFLEEEGYFDGLDAVIIAEPTDLLISPSHKGLLWPTITTEGQTAHGSRPSEGINAIENMWLFLQAFEKELGQELTSHQDPLNGQSSYSVNYFKAGEAVNVVPDQAQVKIDIRTTADQDHQEIRDSVEKLIEDLSQKHDQFKGRVEWTTELLPLDTDLADPFSQLMVEASQEILVKRDVVTGFSGGTDGSWITKADPSVPIIICGPGSLHLAHQPNEYVLVEDFYKAINLYQKVAKDYLNA